MPATTPKGFPYVLPADALVDFPVHSLALATKLEAGTGLPGAELGYAENPATVAGGGTEAAAATVVALPSITFDGSAVIFEFYTPQTSAGAAITGWLYLFDGSTSLGIIGAFVASSNALYARRRMTPSAAAHTYSVRLSQTGGAASVIGAAGGVGVRMPNYLRASRA